ncbi:MAG: polyprenyl synthetase family protein [Candidatus Omnitrophota bacterium]
MFLEIKKRIEAELDKYIHEANELYRLKKISPLLFNAIKEFISREGKRVRPILFVVSYLGFAKKTAPGLYRSALSLELLHDFMLVHDDIIDKSETRRGKPSMHALLNTYLSEHTHVKFSGQDLTIVVGDVMYAMAIHSFLAIREKLERKERALQKLVDAAMYTGSGEFIELLAGLNRIDAIKKQDIYKIYDFKTACYTFATPLSMGAILAGARDEEVKKLFACGIYLGRAFQIKDDILGMFGDEKKIGKSTTTDLQEAKKTILIWYAYHHASSNDKKVIESLLEKEMINTQDIETMRAIVTQSGALIFAEKEIAALVQKVKTLSAASRMQSSYQEALTAYFKKLLAI